MAEFLQHADGLVDIIHVSAVESEGYDTEELLHVPAHGVNVARANIKKPAFR
jgi:hypothetical protein